MSLINAVACKNINLHTEYDCQIIKEHQKKKGIPWSEKDVFIELTWFIDGSLMCLHKGLYLIKTQGPGVGQNEKALRFFSELLL